MHAHAVDGTQAPHAVPDVLFQHYSPPFEYRDVTSAMTAGPNGKRAHINGSNHDPRWLGPTVNKVPSGAIVMMCQIYICI